MTTQALYWVETAVDVESANTSWIVTSTRSGSDIKRITLSHALAVAANDQYVFIAERGAADACHCALADPSCSCSTTFSSGAIIRVSLRLTSPTTIATGQKYPNAIAANDRGVYWILDEAPGVAGIHLGSNKVVNVFAGHASDLALAGSTVYLAAEHQVLAVSQQSPQPTVVAMAHSGNVRAVTADDEDVYWTDGAGLYRHRQGVVEQLVSDAGLSAVRVRHSVVYAMKRTARQVLVIAYAPNNRRSKVVACDNDIADFVVDDERIYWTNEVDKRVAAASLPSSSTSAD